MQNASSHASRAWSLQEEVAPIDLALHCRNIQRLVSEKASIPDDHQLDLIDDEMRFDDLKASGSHGLSCDRYSAPQGLDLARKPLYWVSCSGPTVHPAGDPKYRKKICMLCGLGDSGTKRHLQYHPGRHNSGLSHGDLGGNAICWTSTLWCQERH
ncbi:hypothetical protein AnigIFM59636_006066 [Aspergillus niger]|nr:hypothetical protein AnigIFM59636_006066 [Aspergillus niger]